VENTHQHNNKVAANKQTVKLAVSSNVNIQPTRAVPDSGFVSPARARFNDTNLAGAVICS